MSGNRLVISERIFVDTLYSIAIADIEALHALEQGQKKELPSILILCGKLLQVQYDERVRFLIMQGRCTPKRLWCIFLTVSVQRVEPRKFCQVLLSSRTQDTPTEAAQKDSGSQSRLGLNSINLRSLVEHLHELLNDIAPEERFMFSVDEACIFLGAIKRGGSDGAQMLQSNEEIETSLNQTEFTEYVLRGLNQTARSMRTFASRSEMHHKISRVLKVISESALADYQSRRQKVSSRLASGKDHGAASGALSRQDLMFWLGDLNLEEDADAR